jgi:hypothetical protein
MRLKLQRVDARYADDAFSVRRIRKAYANLLESGKFTECVKFHEENRG